MVHRDIELTLGSWLKPKSAGEFIQKASEYKSSIWIEKDSKKANAKSLLGLLALEITPGCCVRLTADGEDEDEAVAVLGEFMMQNV